MIKLSLISWLRHLSKVINIIRASHVPKYVYLRTQFINLTSACPFAHCAWIWKRNSKKLILKLLGLYNLWTRPRRHGFVQLQPLQQSKSQHRSFWFLSKLMPKRQQIPRYRQPTCRLKVLAGNRVKQLDTLYNRPGISGPMRKEKISSNKIAFTRYEQYITVKFKSRMSNGDFFTTGLA